MSIMDVIQNQVGDDTIRNLSGQMGEDENKTRMAIHAAVPTILAALAKQASTGDGANRFTSMLSSFDTSKIGNMTNLPGVRSGTEPGQGTSMLNSLLGGDMVSSIVSAISRYTNMGAVGVRKVLEFVMPMVVGTIANKFRGEAVTPQAISGFFSSQMPEFIRSLPSGFSLSSIPGFSHATATVQGVTESVKGTGRTATQYARQPTDVFRREPVGASRGSAARWILPLVAVAVVAMLAWNFFNRETADRSAPVTTTTPVARETTPPPATTPPRDTTGEKKIILTGYNPESAELANKLSAAYTEANSIMAGVTDVDSAEAAVPGLTEVNEQIETLSESWEQLPEASRTSINSVTTRKLPEMEQEKDRVLAIPGVAEVLRPVLNDMVTKLSNFKE